jgi:hypothetical protein
MEGGNGDPTESCRFAPKKISNKNSIIKQSPRAPSDPSPRCHSDNFVLSYLSSAQDDTLNDIILCLKMSAKINITY